jgi:hypothetical protein
LAALFSEGEPFDVDRKHIMENIRDHYSIPLEQTPILENMDNCIDEENYREINFRANKNILEIEMIGSGMDQHTFFHVLPKLAGTTKGAKPGLGHYGWGMKVGMCVSEEMTIENKRGDFHAAQRWWLKHGEPWKKRIEPERSLPYDAVIITHKLNEEFSKKITLSLIQETLQGFYPTLLDGVPVLGRKIKVTLNGEPMLPPSWPEYEHKQAIWADIDGQKATGKIYVAKKPLPENLQGIAIIVCGRKITRDDFGIHSKVDDRLTGYLHADMLYQDVKGDKTIIRRSEDTWEKLSKGIGKQLGEFMRKIGALEEKGLDTRDLEFVNRELAKVLADFPELNPMKFEIYKDVLIEKSSGGEPIILRKGGQPTQRTGTGPSRDTTCAVVKPGTDDREGPTPEKGEKRATPRRRKVKSGPEIREINSPDFRKEAWFSEGEGKVWINNAMVSFKKAERWGIKTKRYHVLRCSMDALLEWAVQDERVNLDKYFEIRNELFLKWGGLP